MGMGQASLAMNDGLNINFASPASYHQLSLTTFDVGFEYSLIQQEQSNPPLSINNSRSGMRNISVGVPIYDWWGSALSIQPYSFKGYDIRTSRTLSSDPSVEINDQFVGEGGLNRIIWGNSFLAAKGLSFGVNASYIFGSLRESQIVNFSDFTFVDTRSDRESLISGLSYDFGARYEYPLNENHYLATAISLNNGSRLSSRETAFQYTIDGIRARDTLVGGSEIEGEYQLASDFKAGLSIGKKNENALQAAWAINADFTQFRGSEFSAPTAGNQLTDAYSINVGGMLTPRYTFKSLERGTNLFNNIEYRLGGFYEKLPFELASNELYNYGITFGLGIPVRQRSLAPGEQKVNTVNLGLVAGRRGSLENNLIRENYLSIFLSVTFNDRWFIDYKYR